MALVPRKAPQKIKVKATQPRPYPLAKVAWLHEPPGKRKACDAQLFKGEEWLLRSKSHILDCRRPANGGTEPAERAFEGALWGKDGLWSGRDQLEVTRVGSVEDDTQEWANVLRSRATGNSIWVRFAPGR